MFVATDLTRRLVGGPGWLPWVVAGLVFLPGALLVFYLAKRRDPRLHLFRRPDPLPDDRAEPGEGEAIHREAGDGGLGRSERHGAGSRQLWARVGRYVLAAPIVALMASALVNDPGRLGERSSAADMSSAAFVAIASIITTLLAGVWALSEFRYRTPVACFQVLVVWIGGWLFVVGVRTETTFLDVAEDVTLLATTIVQIVPVRRALRTSVPDPSRDTGTQHQPRV